MKTRESKKIDNSSPSVTWTINGPNWLWKKRTSTLVCPMELATQALEDVWSKKPEIQGTIKSKYLCPGHDEAILGLTLKLTHSQMKTPAEEILVCSIKALANAGYYDEANELQELA